MFQDPKAHYDYKLNNLMFTINFEKINGLFDWEMSTVGNPLADLGVAMSYWMQENDSPLLQTEKEEKPVIPYPGFITRQELWNHMQRKVEEMCLIRISI